MKLVPFDPQHALDIKIQPAQTKTIGNISPEYADSLAAIGPAFTAIDGDEVIVCGGVGMMWEGRHVLWAIFSEQAGKHMVRVVRAISRIIDLQVGCGRLEAVVRSEFEQGHRLARMVGLEFHHHEEKFLPGGHDADIYVRFC